MSPRFPIINGSQSVLSQGRHIVTWTTRCFFLKKKLIRTCQINIMNDTFIAIGKRCAGVTHVRGFMSLEYNATSACITFFNFQIVDKRGPGGPEWTRVDQRDQRDQRGPGGPEGLATVMAEIVDKRGPGGTRVDQRGPAGTRGDPGDQRVWRL